MADIADWGRSDPFGKAVIAAYAQGDELVDDLLVAVARRLDGEPAGFAAVARRLAVTDSAAGPALARAHHRLPLDPLELQILAFTLAWELSPTLHRRLGTLDREALAEWTDPPASDALTRALHPAGALVGFELVTVGAAGPWFAQPVRATAAACLLATEPARAAPEPELPALGEIDPRLVEVFGDSRSTVTIVRGDRAFETVLATAAEAGVRVIVGGTPPRTVAAAIRESCIAGRMPVLLCHAAHAVERQLLARVSGPRCLVLAGSGPLALATVAT